METVAAIFPPLMFVLLHVLEAIFPAQRRRFSLGWRVQGFVVFALGGAIVENLPLLWQDLTAGVSVLGLSDLPLVPSVLLVWVTMNFVGYWLHRARHGVTALWRLHQLHHSAERFDVSGAFLFHPLEVCYIPIMGTLVGSMILGVSPQATMVTGMLGVFSAMFQHSNLRTPRWLGYLIQRPESHSVHHGRGVHAFNYCDLPVIDMMFGTFRNPTAHEEAHGFWDGASKKIPQMLAALDVTAR